MPAVVPFETAPQLFHRLSTHYAGTGKAALGYKDRATKTWTDIPWDDLRERVHQLAGFLHARGVRAGDRVAILSENRPEWAVADLATQVLGAVTVALYTTTPASQVAYVVRDSGAVVLIVSTGLQLRKADRAYDDCPDLRAIVSMAEPRKARPDTPVTTWADALAEGARHAVTLDERINDFKLGVLTGYPGWDVVAAEYPELARLRLEDPLKFHPDQGESGTEVFARVGDFLADLPTDADANLVVCHGVINKFIRAVHRGITGSDIIALGESQYSVFRLDGTQETELDLGISRR